MIDWFARLEPYDGPNDADPDAWPEFEVKRECDALLVGTRNARGCLTVSILRTFMRYVAHSRLGSSSKLVWSFSSVAIPLANLDALLRRWDETDEPPILSIIALAFGDSEHHTRGVVCFAGIELAARFSVAARSRDAARNLARLTRHVLVNGQLDRNATYEGIDGHELHLDWSNSFGPAGVVTIVL